MDLNAEFAEDAEGNDGLVHWCTILPNRDKGDEMDKPENLRFDLMTPMIPSQVLINF